MKLKRLTLCGVLTAVSLAIFVLEAQLPPLLPVPGVKPGLANLITLFSLLYLTPKETCLILLARILLGAVFTASPATLLYSLTGGFLCLGTELVLLHILHIKDIWAVSAVGAMIHNLAQLIVAAWVTGTASVFWYLPILLIFGILTGLFTGFCIHLYQKRFGNRIKHFLS